MSEIYDNPTIQIMSGTLKLGAPQPEQGNCEFCNTYSYNGYNLMNKLVCENCREKLLKRINLIMNFE